MRNAVGLLLADRFAIEELLFRFAASFDEKSWEAMRDCLDETLYVDYSGLREIKGLVASGDYVAQRTAALEGLVMQHDLSNLRIQAEEDGKAVVLCNFTIRRFPASNVDDFFHSYGRYRFTVVQRPDGWRIAGIVQAITRNRGNPRLHAGLTVNRKS